MDIITWDVLEISKEGFSVPFVIALAALCEIFMGVYVTAEIKEKYLPAVILKGIASFFFVLIGLFCNPGGKTGDLILLGLFLGFIADILLNLQYVLNKNGMHTLVLGAFGFLVGHVAYLLAILPRISNKLLYVLLGIAFTAILELWLFKRITAERNILIFGTLYMGLVSVLGTMAIGNIIENSATRVFSIMYALGIILFYLSDVVLIVNHFGKEIKDILRVLNGVLYYTGQILIAMSLMWLGIK